MDEEQTQEEEVTTEEYETDSDSESEATEGDSETGDSERTYTKAELEEQLKARDKRWKDRLKDSKKSTKESGNESKEEVDERYDRLELKTEGITSKKEQDIVLDYARWKGIPVTEAATASTVRVELAELRSKNVPAPSTRTSKGATDSYDYYVKNIKAGKLRLADVSDASMRQRLMKGKIF